MSVTRRDVLNGIRGIEGVDKVALISKSGMFIDGDNFDEEDTFSAMSAIILGAAETVSMNFGMLKKVVVHLEDGRVFIITSVGKKGVLAVLAEKDVYDEIEKLKGEFENII